MAMIKYGTGIEQYSGKYGGGIFYSDGCSYHQIAKPSPQRQHSPPARQVVRNAFRESARLWTEEVANDPVCRANLDNWAVRNRWFNRKRELYHPTSYQLFIRFAMFYILYGALALLEAWIGSGCPPL